MKEEFFRRLSVCLATYNGEPFLLMQLESIAEQLNERDEIVISDDASSDGTLECVNHVRAKFPLINVRLVGSSRAGGVVPNFERAIMAAQGDGVVLCDQDDVWLPGRLEIIRAALGRSDLVILNGEVVDEALQCKGQTVFELVGMKKGFWSNWIKNSFIGCCMAFRSDIRTRVMPFPVGVPWHDWYIGLFVEAVGNVERIDEVTMFYRRHGANFSPTGEASGNSLAVKLMMRVRVLRAVVIALLRQPSKQALRT